MANLDPGRIGLPSHPGRLPMGLAHSTGLEWVGSAFHWITRSWGRELEQSRCHSFILIESARDRINKYSLNQLK